MRVNPILMILVSFYSPDTELKNGTSLFVQSVHPADISDFEKSQFFDFFFETPLFKDLYLPQASSNSNNSVCIL